jgi:glyoxylate carboligase
MKAAKMLVRCLENEGVERVFGVPGEENLDLLEALRSAAIELVLTRHEQPAAFMAATYGRLTGRPGVCLSTLGPGALNLATGAAYAHLGAMPMVLITGQKGIMTSRQARFQMVDMVATMRPLTKSSRQIVSAASIPTLVRDAFREAAEERPGPVHLELPEDIAAEPAPDVPPVSPHPIELPVAPPAALDRAAAMILAAERPLVMLGAAASRPRLADALSAFIKRTRIPFFNTQLGVGIAARSLIVMAHEQPRLVGQLVQDPPDRAEQLARAAAREVGARRAGIRHEGVADERRVTDHVDNVGRGMARSVHDLRRDLAQPEGVAGLEQHVELAAGALDLGAGVENLAEHVLDGRNLGADRKLAAELLLDVRRSRQMVGADALRVRSATAVQAVARSRLCMGEWA